MNNILLSVAFRGLITLNAPESPKSTKFSPANISETRKDWAKEPKIRPHDDVIYRYEDLNWKCTWCYFQTIKPRLTYHISLCFFIHIFLWTRHILLALYFSFIFCIWIFVIVVTCMQYIQYIKKIIEKLYKVKMQLTKNKLCTFKSTNDQTKSINCGKN